MQTRSVAWTAAENCTKFPARKGERGVAATSGMRRDLPSWSGWLVLCLLWTCVSAPDAVARNYHNANCIFPRFSFVDEGVTAAQLMASSSAACVFHFEISESTNRSVGILSSNVTLRPKNGLLGSNTIRIFAYKPNEGFPGNDQFGIRVRYNRRSGDHQSLLHVDVSVTQ